MNKPFAGKVPKRKKSRPNWDGLFKNICETLTCA